MRASHFIGQHLLLAGIFIPTLAPAQTWTDFQVGNTTRQALVYVPVSTALRF